MPTRDFFLQQQLSFKAQRDRALINVGRCEGAIEVLGQLAAIAEGEEAAQEGREAVADAMADAADTQLDPPEAPDAGKAAEPVAGEWAEPEGDLGGPIPRMQPARMVGADRGPWQEAIDHAMTEATRVPVGSGVPGDDGEAIDPLGR